MAIGVVDAVVWVNIAVGWQAPLPATAPHRQQRLDNGRVALLGGLQQRGPRPRFEGDIAQSMSNQQKNTICLSILNAAKQWRTSVGIDPIDEGMQHRRGKGQRGVWVAAG